MRLLVTIGKNMYSSLIYNWAFLYLASMSWINPTEKELSNKVYDLNSAEDGEASEESHCASNHSQLCHQGNLKM